jgi:hypothetical protein
MKIKLLLLTMLCTSIFIGAADAQTYGVWTGSTETTFWDYDLGAGVNSLTSTTTAQESISTNSTAGFLPVTPSGSVRVGIPTTALGAGGFSLAASKLTITSTNGNTPAKFSVYGVNAASQVSSIFYTLSFNSTTATNGLVILGIGNSSAPVFSNTSQLTGSLATGIFAGLTFTVGATTVIPSYRYKNVSSTYSYSTLYNKNLDKSSIYNIEIYCNNSGVNQTYVRELVTYTLPSRTYNFWVDGVRLSTSSGGGAVNIPASADESLAETVIDAFTLNSSNNTTPTNNSLNLSISDIKFGRIPLKVLPVSLTAFNGKKQGAGIQLDWSTAAEANSSHFEVLRSSNQSAFVTLGTVKSKGNSIEKSNYYYTDFNPFAGINYYKLKQVDLDGKTFETEPIAVSSAIRATADFKIFVKDEHSVELSFTTTAQEIADFVITDVNGKKYLNTKVSFEQGKNLKTVSLPNMPSGMYVASVYSGNTKQNVKFFKN